MIYSLKYIGSSAGTLRFGVLTEMWCADILQAEEEYIVLSALSPQV